MTVLVPSDSIEQIIGVRRDPHRHVGRAVDGQLVIMHPQSCIDSGMDLRECIYSMGLDNGLSADDVAELEAAQGRPVELYVVSGSTLRVGDLHLAEPLQIATLSTATHRIRGGVAMCDGDSTSKCHWRPDCGSCETFPCGHEYVDHGECWIVPWINASDLEDSAMSSALERYDPDHPLDASPWPDGLIEWEWDGDYVTWTYVTHEILDDMLPIADAIVDSIRASADTTAAQSRMGVE